MRAEFSGDAVAELVAFGLSERDVNIVVLLALRLAVDALTFADVRMVCGDDEADELDVRSLSDQVPIRGLIERAKDGTILRQCLTASERDVVIFDGLLELQEARERDSGGLAGRAEVVLARFCASWGSEVAVPSAPQSASIGWFSLMESNGRVHLGVRPAEFAEFEMRRMDPARSRSEHGRVFDPMSLPLHFEIDQPQSVLRS
ncbi:MAG: hypothetical protein ABIT01_08165 [Thermoanaerobaculia bacterium]